MAGDYNNFDHHSTRFLKRIKDFSFNAGEEIEQELWVLSKKAKTVTTVNHEAGFILKLFPVSLNFPLPLEISWSIIKAVFLYKEENVVWHLHSYYLFLNDILGVILFFKRFKFVIHHRGGGPSWTLKATLYTIYHYLFGLRIVLNLASRVFVQNHDEAIRVSKILFKNNSKLIYFPNTVGANLVEKLEHRSKSIVREEKIMIAGRAIKILNSKEVIKLLLDCAHNFNITIVGCSNKEKEILKAEFINSAKVTIKGWMSKEELIDELLSGSIFFHTNMKENFEGSPSTLIEAQACGLPSLGFGIAGVKDVIKDGYNGFLFADINEAFLRLPEILKKKEEINKMRDNCLKNVKENFLDENYFPQLIEIYKSLFKKI